MFHSIPPKDATPIGPIEILPSDAPELRLLGAEDTEAFAAHLLRLDEASRRLRFGAPVRDEFVAAYARRPSSGKIARIGLVEAGTLRGVAELHRDPHDPALAEGAFSLESRCRRRGFGTQLFAALLDEARTHGVRRLTLQCLRENVAMQRIARRFRSELAFEGSEITATLRVPAAAPGPAAAGAPAPALARWLGLPAAALSCPVPA